VRNCVDHDRERARGRLAGELTVRYAGHSIAIHVAGRDIQILDHTGR